MKKLMLVACLAALLAASAFGQTEQCPRFPLRSPVSVFFWPVRLFYAAPLPETPAQAVGAKANSSANLEQVLSLLDRASASFKSVQVDFVWDQYQKVVDEHDIQKGVMYFKRAGSSVDVAADILQPEHKKLVFANGKVRLYSFKTGQETQKDAGKDREEFESYLALGFGGSGHELLKNFDVRYAGEETVDGMSTYKLELTPKAQKVRNMFRRFTLWIDPKTGMSVQQKALEGDYDYRLAKYSSIKLNQKLPEDAFKLKAN